MTDTPRDLLDHDLTGIYRRTAHIHGCTPADVKRWMEGGSK